MTFSDLYNRCNDPDPEDEIWSFVRPFVAKTAFGVLTRITGLPVFLLDFEPPALALRFPKEHIPEEARSEFGNDIKKYRAWRKVLLDCQSLETGQDVDGNYVDGLNRLARLFVHATSVNPIYYLPTLLPEGTSPCDLTRTGALSIDAGLEGLPRATFRRALGVLDKLGDNDIARRTGLLPCEKIGPLPRVFDHAYHAKLPVRLKRFRDAQERPLRNAIDFTYRVATMAGILAEDSEASFDDLLRPQTFAQLENIDIRALGFERPNEKTYRVYLQRIAFRARNGVPQSQVAPDEPWAAAWWRLSKQIADLHGGEFPARATIVRKHALADQLAPVDLTPQWFQAKAAELSEAQSKHFRTSAFFFDDLAGTGIDPRELPPAGSGFIRKRARKARVQAPVT
ncbi:hypothetical protein GQE99_16265 [Maritimibacter sp. DP07]|uniref:Uncharacterized protein n=1 Tax=Maritimibacter harenae TaxID=2606218 RepID=A0A845M3G5_9RHOB|nr:hypothetical protein [Maritimibacter harenae]MZR14575.1 hypothetical protein [Maritimibacter harenae]